MTTSRPDTTETDAGPQLPELICIHSERRPFWDRVGRLSAALALIIAGIVVWLVPVVGGSWFFYVPGFILLGTASRRAGRWVNRMEHKLPLRARLMLRPKAVRAAFHAARAAAEAGESAAPGATNDGRPAPHDAAPAGD